jgi:hypothetical protein
MSIPCSFVNMKDFNYPEDKNPAESKNILKEEQKQNTISKIVKLQKMKAAKKIRGEK